MSDFEWPTTLDEVDALFAKWDAQRQAEREKLKCDVCGKQATTAPMVLVAWEHWSGDAFGWMRCCGTVCARKAIGLSMERFRAEVRA